VIRPIRLPVLSVNQRLPSGPVVMLDGAPYAVGTVNSVTTPEGVIRPIRLPRYSVNQRLPSGPEVMPLGAPSTVGTANSFVTTTAEAGAARSASAARTRRGRSRQLEGNRPVAIIATLLLFRTSLVPPRGEAADAAACRCVSARNPS
jgi:hypothetical protein